MNISQEGLDLIKRSEGLRLNVYKDAAGIPTIGWGHKCQAVDSFPGGIDEAMAEHILACDVDEAAQAVDRLVKVPLTQGQFDALVDWVFNLGEGRLAKSTFLTCLNDGNYANAAEQMILWCHAGGEELPALVTRRNEELKLWNAANAVLL